MEPKLIFWPVLAQVALTIFMFIRIATVKARSREAGDVDLSRSALHPDAWPDYVLQVTNNVRNQFEMPVLFYVVALALWALGEVNAATLSLAWVFVASRLAHAYIHTGSNIVKYRLRMFKLGTLALVGLFAFAVKAML
ncbi:MAG: hypothetical protein DRH30_12615 [Deltaproteobacteria bacterium]|nr:MAG: hypothetical protein DRH30_12615 [Deltaproteobacteria bacterium]